MIILPSMSGFRGKANPFPLSGCCGWWRFTDYNGGTVPDRSGNGNVLTEVGSTSAHQYGRQITDNNTYFTLSPTNAKAVWIASYMDHAAAVGVTAASHIALIGESNSANGWSYIFSPVAASYAVSVDGGSSGDQGYVSINSQTEVGTANVGTWSDVGNRWSTLRIRFTAGAVYNGTAQWTTIGRFLNPGTYQTRGIFAEIIMFTDYPSAAVVSKIDTYLNNKYSPLFP